MRAKCVGRRWWLATGKFSLTETKTKLGLKLQSFPAAIGQGGATVREQAELDRRIPLAFTRHIGSSSDFRSGSPKVHNTLYA